MTANPNTPNPGTSHAAPAPQTGNAPQGVDLPPDIPFRIGQGYDLHVLVEGRPLIIGGVHVEHPLGLAGHSDADVAAHALCDAMLLATGLGELGTVFGVDRPEWAGASGRALLEEVRRMTAEAGWVLGNATVQVVGNRPRMAARLPEACAVMSEIAGGTVTVSATTSDHLGFTGRGEGVAALASVLMVRVAPASN